MDTFQTAVTPYMKELHGYCSYLASSSWDAEDLVQETMLRMLGHYRKTGKVIGSKNWMFTVARNIWIDQHRKNKSRASTVPIESMTFVVQSADYISIRTTMEWMSDYLSDREIRMLILYEVYRYTYREIAQANNCTVSTVKMVLYHAKRRLKTAVEGMPQSSSRNETKEAGRTAGKAKLPSLHRTYQVEYWTKRLVQFDAGMM